MLSKKKSRLPVLQWYMKQIVKESIDFCEYEYDSSYDSEGSEESGSYEEENQHIILINRQFKYLLSALENNKEAFDIMIKELELANYPYQVSKFIKYIINHDHSEHLITVINRIDPNGYFTQSMNGEIECQLVSLAKKKNFNEALQQIMFNFKLVPNIIPEFDPDKFEKCPICLEPPMNVIVLPCDHFNCTKCFFKYMNENHLRIVCALCRNEVYRLDKLKLFYFPFDFASEPIELHRCDRTFISVAKDGQVTVYC